MTSQLSTAIYLLASVGVAFFGCNSDEAREASERLSAARERVGQLKNDASQDVNRAKEGVADLVGHTRRELADDFDVADEIERSPESVGEQEQRARLKPEAQTERKRQASDLPKSDARPNDGKHRFGFN